jgi:SAM-dependent methyltransferase
VLIEDRLFDFRYKTDTCEWAQLSDLTIDSTSKERGRRYQPTMVNPLRKLFKELRPIFPGDTVFIDLGCGKGRVLLIASKFGFREVRGVEFAHELCEIAKNNCSVYRDKTGVRTVFKIIESDVADYRISPDENVFYMFNPFDATILRKVLDNISDSLLMHPRRILIIYYNPECYDVIEKRSNFEKIREFSFIGHRLSKVSVYSSKRPAK